MGWRNRGELARPPLPSFLQPRRAPECCFFSRRIRLRLFLSTVTIHDLSQGERSFRLPENAVVPQGGRRKEGGELATHLFLSPSRRATQSRSEIKLCRDLDQSWRTTPSAVVAPLPWVTAPSTSSLPTASTKSERRSSSFDSLRLVERRGFERSGYDAKAAFS